jgi:hypothetical protein
LGQADQPRDGLLVRIYALNGTTLGAASLASATVPLSSLPQPAADWVHVPLSPPAAVTAGSTYVIVVTQLSPRDIGWTLSGDPSNDAYPRCDAGFIAGVAEGGVFVPGFNENQPSPEGDFAFKTYVSVPGTPESLCRDTHAALRSSPKYARNKKAVDAAANVLCGILARIGPRMTPAQKAKFVALYKAGLPPLVRSGWLTGTQAAELSATADRLAAGS